MFKTLSAKSLMHTIAAGLCLFAFAMVLVFSFTNKANAQQMNSAQMQTEIDRLTALIQQLTASLGGGSSTPTGSVVCPFTWTRTLSLGDSGADVQRLQQFLNQSPDTQVSSYGVGSPGNEGRYYGAETASAVSKFQAKYRADILAPVGLVSPNGFFGISTRAKMNSLCSSQSYTTVSTDLTNFSLYDSGNAGAVIGRQDNPLAEIDIPAVNEDRYLNEVMLDFMDEDKNERAYRIFDDLSLWIDGNKIYEIDVDQVDWDGVGLGHDRVTIFDKYDLGGGVLIPAGQSVRAVIAGSLKDSAKTGYWQVAFPVSGIKMWSESTGDISVGKGFADDASFYVYDEDDYTPETSLVVDVVSISESSDYGNDTTTSDDKGVYTFTFDVTATGDDDVYISNKGEIVPSNINLKSHMFGVHDSNNYGYRADELESVGSVVTSTSRDSRDTVNAFIVREGDIRRFVLQVTVDPVATESYSVSLEILAHSSNGNMSNPNWEDLDYSEFKSRYLMIRGTSDVITPTPPTAPTPPAPGNTAADKQRKSDLKEIAGALQDYFGDNNTFQIHGTGVNGKGFGYISHKGGAYPDSVTGYLASNGYLSRDIKDPSGQALSNLKTNSGYMMYLDQEGTTGKNSFTLWANLDNPTAADLATQDSCAFGLYDNHHSSYAKEARMNYCISGSATASAPEPKMTVNIDAGYGNTKSVNNVLTAPVGTNISLWWSGTNADFCEVNSDSNVYKGPWKELRSNVAIKAEAQKTTYTIDCVTHGGQVATDVISIVPGSVLGASTTSLSETLSQIGSVLNSIRSGF